ncbi:MAG: PAS domain-containing sensor histidine kinase [Ruminococcaceae bacterium]|nr:PAS domain-containing sensor histidine kinase [Oscillospiraceae bacterium]
MKKRLLRDPLLTLGILALCFGASILMQDLFAIPEQVTTTFTFGVFLISLLTEGYVWGLVSALAGVLLVNYAFTFPYFALNFLIPSNFYSAVVLTVISVLTSALTTKLKRAEAMKAESEKERMRANLLRAISHDLRTPLTTIYGSSTALRENGDRFSDRQRDDMLRGIQEDAQWLVQMVENLLSVTRIDSGQVRLNKIATALDELVDAALVGFRKRYPAQNVELDLPEELVLIPMDALLIRQVLINIMENAVRHGAGLTRITLRVTVKDGWAVFEVLDDGCGIPQDRLPHLFTGLYASESRSGDRSGRNMGIGLSVCATIIHAHGGAIFAENRPQGGARFCFSLQTEESDDE